MVDKHNIAPVSVVIPCYRAFQTIVRAVDSVLAQTMTPAEIILIDDFSNDETLTLLYELQSRAPHLIKVIALDKNYGVSYARNLGWSHAKQSYISFLDSDDAWHNKKIEIQYSYMRDHPGISLSGHGSRVLQPSSALPKWDVNSEFDVFPINKRSLLLSNPFITPSVMLHRDLVERFIENRRHMEDHMLWLEIIFGGAQVVKIDLPLAATYKKSFGEAGLSSQLLEMQLGDLDNYKNLFKKKYINSFQWTILFMYSWCKFIRRVIISLGHSISRAVS